MSGGFGDLPFSFHFSTHLAVRVPVRWLCLSMRWMKRVMHFADTCVTALPPFLLGCCSVTSGTVKIKMGPFHKKYDIAVFICCMLSFGGGRFVPCTMRWQGAPHSQSEFCLSGLVPYGNFPLLVLEFWMSASSKTPLQNAGSCHSSGTVVF